MYNSLHFNVYFLYLFQLLFVNLLQCKLIFNYSDLHYKIKYYKCTIKILI